VTALAPDFAEPLEAWRVWRVVGCHGELSLASVMRRTVWPAGEPLRAECLVPRAFGWLRRRPQHDAPEEACDCGIYAADLEEASRYLYDSLPDALARVVGQVSLWGVVVECERGLRASRAYPGSLYVSRGTSRDPDAVDDLAAGLERYGVPVEVLTDDRPTLARLLEALS